MTAKNKAREQVAVFLLVTGMSLLALGWLSGPGLRFFLDLLGWMLLAVGTVMYIALSVINGVPWVIRFMSLNAEPVWDGEILHTDGGWHKIRYVFDDRGIAHFVANDICIAAGTNPPLKDVRRWGGVPLLRCGENLCFSESGVQDYLMPLAQKNYDANRLLILIRRNVLKKLDKQRDEAKQYG